MQNKITKDRQVALVLSSFGKKGSIAEFCNEHRIARSTFYGWRKALLARLSENYGSSKSNRRSV